MSKDKFSQFKTCVQDKSIPEGMAKCMDCGTLVPATFIDLSTHYQLEANISPENKENVSDYEVKS